MDTTTKLLAWHGDPELRERIVLRMKEHAAADAIVQGIYQRIDPSKALGYRGCAIGCLLDQQPIAPVGCGDCDCALCSGPKEPAHGWHVEVEKQFGIPHRLAVAIDNTFERLPAYEAGDFALAVTEAVPVGADLSGVAATWAVEVDSGRGMSAGVRRRTDEFDRWCAERLIHHIKAAGEGTTS